jgi:hypothetical protein
MKKSTDPVAAAAENHVHERILGAVFPRHSPKTVTPVSARRAILSSAAPTANATLL